MSQVTATCSSPYKTEITTRDHQWLADEPEEHDGTDTGPTPMEMLLGSIASCMAITMRMYAGRKEWPLETVKVEIGKERVKPEDCPSYENNDGRSQIDVITARITLEGDLDEKQRQRIAEIGGKCPVHKLVASGAHFIDELRVE